MQEFFPNVDFINYIWGAIGTAFALPGALFITYTSVQRLKFVSMLGTIIGAIIGYFVTYFVWATALHSSNTVAGATVLVACFFISSIVGLAFALLINVLFGGSPPSTHSTQVEF